LSPPSTGLERGADVLACVIDEEAFNE
jgi:hypothetical protein